MLSRQETEQIENRSKFSAAITLVVLMILSSMYGVTDILSSTELTLEVNAVDSNKIERVQFGQSTDQGGQGGWTTGEDVLSANIHEALTNMMWSDPGVGSGIIVDISVLEEVLPRYTTFLEDPRAGDHDNDGADDHEDDDDDNDGILDEFEL
jgi:hypothetical protein